MSIPEHLKEIRELVDQETVVCSRTTEFFNDLRGAGLNNPRLLNCVDPCYADCPKCNGTGQAPDPAYDPLREVVTGGICLYKEGTTTPYGASMSKKHPTVYYHPNPCPMCHNTNRTTRSWEGKPDWWLATLLVQAGIKAGLLSPLSNSHLLGDPAKAAEAVIAALKEQKDG